MEKKEYFYPVWLRLWHLLNALLCLLLIISGISIHYASAGFQLIHFEVSVSIHQLCGLILIFNYVFYFIANLISGNIRQYIPRKGFVKKCIIQTKFYLFDILKGQPHPFSINKSNKFNPLQQITYLKIMYVLLPLMIVTGLFLLFPWLAGDKIAGYNSLTVVGLLHLIFAFVITLFIIGHVYMASISKKPFANFKAIVNGWHDVEEE